MKAIYCMIMAQVWGWNHWSAAGDVAVHRFSVIAERNVFALKADVPEPSTSTGPAPLPRLFLTGLAHLGAHQFACVTVAGESPRSYALRVGQADNDLELVSINRAAQTAMVRHAGVDRLLHLGVPPRTGLPQEELAERRPQRPPDEPIPGGV